MIPLIWLLGGVAATVGYLHAKKAKETTVVKTSPVLAQALAQPPSAPGVVTPARAAVHGELMARCIDPNKLKQAAALFGHEELPQHAQALLQKAALLHQMMHGAKDIVERSRQGDQHAMALAKSIGDQARAGNQRAQVSWVLIEDYTKRNPVEGPPRGSLPAGQPA